MGVYDVWRFASFLVSVQPSALRGLIRASGGMLSLPLVILSLGAPNASSTSPAPNETKRRVGNEVTMGEESTQAELVSRVAELESEVAELRMALRMVAGLADTALTLREAPVRTST